MPIEQLASSRCFGGLQQQYRHRSGVLDCSMRFSIYLPPQADATHPVPVLYWLSGLTCSDENFSHKAGAQRIAAELGIALVMPDTSPRGEGVADEPEAYDLGQGAGFYLNATQEPWKPHYRMYDYLVSDLPELIEARFPVTRQRAISGHSMGGLGALVVALRNPERYASVSAFSPISNPGSCPWGEKALSAYLGDDRSSWQEYDPCALLRRGGATLPLLVDQGDADPFLTRELQPEALLEAAAAGQYPLQLRMQPGYDHSYFFIASFIEEHLRFHAHHLARG